MQQQVTRPPRRHMIVGTSGATGKIYGLRDMHAGLVRRWSGTPIAGIPTTHAAA
ncbi:hypothetical protein [Roseixanthobacter pseudopolyaromaticivorans]|uniref:hypothetical protein n=1 Tax=Xanthobacteraceae TaxID=335928 RepID=UPI00372AF6F9